MSVRIDWERNTIRIPRRHVWWARSLLLTADAAARHRDALMLLILGALLLDALVRDDTFLVVIVGVLIGARIERSVRRA